MKTFKQLREALDKDNPEAAALKPRAQGEQDFVDAHTKNITDYPVKNADNSKISSADHHPENGDRSPVQQGSSKLADKSGFKGSKTPLTRADKTQGDFKPIRNSLSSVTSMKESLFVNQPMISESEEDTIFIELMNGDSIEINEDTWDAVHEVFGQLNTGNREVFRAAINENADSFEKILEFVIETLGDE